MTSCGGAVLAIHTINTAVLPYLPLGALVALSGVCSGFRDGKVRYEVGTFLRSARWALTAQITRTLDLIDLTLCVGGGEPARCELALVAAGQGSVQITADCSWGLLDILEAFGSPRGRWSNIWRPLLLMETLRGIDVAQMHGGPEGRLIVEAAGLARAPSCRSEIAGRAVATPEGQWLLDYECSESEDDWIDLDDPDDNISEDICLQWLEGRSGRS